MPTTNGVRKGDVIVLVGTRKGAFILSGGVDRKTWRLSGPHCASGDIFHMVYDPRQGGTILAADNNPFWGNQVQISHDLGGTWNASEQDPKMSDGSDLSVLRLWNIEPGREDEPGVMYLGAEPASLFRSSDWGNTWSSTAA